MLLHTRNLEKLGTKIERIDAFDISHQYMQQGVGSCVVFAEMDLQKRLQTFNISRYCWQWYCIDGEYDFKRLKHYEDQKPDLILIDGGKAQLNFTNRLLKNFDMEKILVLAIAKGRGRVRATETIYTSKGVIEIDPHSESFKLLNELRDESHRFAITAQRNKKK